MFSLSGKRTFKFTLSPVFTLSVLLFIAFKASFVTLNSYGGASHSTSILQISMIVVLGRHGFFQNIRIGFKRSICLSD